MILKPVIIFVNLSFSTHTLWQVAPYTRSICDTSVRLIPQWASYGECKIVSTWCSPMRWVGNFLFDSLLQISMIAVITHVTMVDVVLMASIGFSVSVLMALPDRIAAQVSEQLGWRGIHMRKLYGTCPLWDPNSIKIVYKLRKLSMSRVFSVPKT